eukprot:9488505-Prorocentrum_lima.AAC.1
MGDCSAIVIKGVTGPNAGVCVIQPVVIRVVVQLFPCEVTGDDRPHLADIIQVPRPFEMP